MTADPAAQSPMNAAGMKLTEAERETVCIGGFCDYLSLGKHEIDCTEHIAAVEAIVAARVDAALAPVRELADEWERAGRLGHHNAGGFAGALRAALDRQEDHR